MRKPNRNPAPPQVSGNIGIPTQHFKGIAVPGDDFIAIANNLRSPPLGNVINLSVARSVALGNAVVIGFAGNSFYVDAATDVGNASVHFQDTNLTGQQPPIFIGPQFIARVPFTRMIFENTAQAGKVLRFFYGVDIDFVPGINNQTVIVGSVNMADTNGNSIASIPATGLPILANRELLVADGGLGYGTSFKSTTALAALTSEQVLAPGSNVNGVMVTAEGGITTNASAFAMLIFQAHTSAPNSFTVGDLLAASNSGCSIAGSVGTLAELKRPVRVASGKGLYHTVGSADVTGFRYANYVAF